MLRRLLVVVVATADVAWWALRHAGEVAPEPPGQATEEFGPLPPGWCPCCHRPVQDVHVHGDAVVWRTSEPGVLLLTDPRGEHAALVDGWGA